jgi:hypothetical protein
MRYFGAGTHIIVAVAGMVVVHVHLAIVEVHVRHIAISPARARLLLNFVHSPDIFYKIPCVDSVRRREVF